MSIKSIDPRVTRESLPEQPDTNPMKEFNHWQTYFFNLSDKRWICLTTISQASSTFSHLVIGRPLSG
ncbi:MAG: hypothetical protein LH629_07785, partial [Ignavibacteria bacterium]|nr:hypothetical protein [Ignavibacteria bacterium]